MRFEQEYTLQATKSFDKSVKKLPKNLKEALDQKLKLFAQQKNYNSLNTKKLVVRQQFLNKNSIDEVWEFRLNSSLRCIFYVNEKEKLIILVFVGKHEEVQKLIK